MPLWKIYHPVGAYTPQDKQALVKRINDARCARGRLTREQP